MEKTEELIKENDELKERLAIQKTEFEEEIENLKSELRQKRATILMNNDHYFEVDMRNKTYKQKLEKIKEEVKKIGACDHCGWEECNKGCASYILLQIIESEE